MEEKGPAPPKPEPGKPEPPGRPPQARPPQPGVARPTPPPAPNAIARIRAALSDRLRQLPSKLQQWMGSLCDRGDTLRRGAPEQVMRLGVVIVLGLSGVMSVRAWVVPTRFKDVELHRQQTIEREVARPVKYAGAIACAECHEEQVLEKRTGHHRTVACESCHGPCFQHAQDQSEGSNPFAPRLRDYCVLCHAYDPSRPTGFPQIVPASHNPLKPCIECHKPHAPVPKETPRECGACHGEIERTKAVSAHATLSCTVCHETASDAHKNDPHAHRPSKPEVREFCGKCHARGAEHKAAPKLDIATHGEKYLCWECHYPHMPEAR